VTLSVHRVLVSLKTIVTWTKGQSSMISRKVLYCSCTKAH